MGLIAVMKMSAMTRAIRASGIHTAKTSTYQVIWFASVSTVSARSPVLLRSRSSVFAPSIRLNSRRRTLESKSVIL